MKKVAQKTRNKKKESDFGKGLSYCLGLFLAHERDSSIWCKDPKTIRNYDSEMWFNGSSDHLFELEIPGEFPKSLKNRLNRFKTKVLNWGHDFKGDATSKDVRWSLGEAKELLRLVDEEFGIKTIEAKWK